MDFSKIQWDFDAMFMLMVIVNLSKNKSHFLKLHRSRCINTVNCIGVVYINYAADRPILQQAHPSFHKTDYIPDQNASTESCSVSSKKFTIGINVVNTTILIRLFSYVVKNCFVFFQGVSYIEVSL